MCFTNKTKKKNEFRLTKTGAIRKTPYNLNILLTFPVSQPPIRKVYDELSSNSQEE